MSKWLDCKKHHRQNAREIVDLLLNSGARVNDIVEEDENALIKASGSRHVDVVQLLLSRGADVNMRGWSGDRAL